MKTSNTNLDKLRDRARNMFAEHGSMEKVIKDLTDNPIVYILQNDGNQYELLTSPDKKSYQMRDVSGKVLDEKPLENHVMLLLQQLAASQISELLLATKIEEFDTKVTELEKRTDDHETRMSVAEAALDNSAVVTLEVLHQDLDNEGVPRKNADDVELTIWHRVARFAKASSDKRAKEIYDDLHMPSMVGGGSTVQHARRADLRLMDSAPEVDRLTSPIEIILSGYTHTGKTLLSVLMEKAFRDAGFDNIKLMNPEESPDGRADILQRLAELKLMLRNSSIKKFASVKRNRLGLVNLCLSSCCTTASIKGFLMRLLVEPNIHVNLIILQQLMARSAPSKDELNETIYVQKSDALDECIYFNPNNHRYASVLRNSERKVTVSFQQFPLPSEPRQQVTSTYHKFAHAKNPQEAADWIEAYIIKGDLPKHYQDFNPV
jgi:hypothetical protein